MKYQTHLLTAATAGAALVHTTDLEPTVGLFAGILAGALLPDVDEPNSYIGQKNTVKVMRTRIGISTLIKGLFGHRGITHSLLAAFLMFLPYWFLAPIVGSLLVSSFLLGLAYGYLFHILGDLLSKSGVPLFLPFHKGRVKIPIYVTGKFSEKIVFAASSVLFVYFVYQIASETMVRAIGAG